VERYEGLVKRLAKLGCGRAMADSGDSSMRTCVGFGRFEGKCGRQADTPGGALCERCETLRRECVSALRARRLAEGEGDRWVGGAAYAASGTVCARDRASAHASFARIVRSAWS